MKEKICIIGLGEIGLQTALYCKDKGFETWGIDLSTKVVEESETWGINATTNWNELPGGVNKFLICVSTDYKDNDIDVSQVLNVCGQILDYKQKKNIKYILVSIESTIIPTTCLYVWKNIFLSHNDIFLIHVPQRFWAKDPEGRGVRRKRLIGAINSPSMQYGIELYMKQLNMPLFPVSIEAAELAKISENAYRYLQISFAEELKMLCVKLGISFEQVRESIMSATPDMHYLPEARDGINGHCLPMAANWLSKLVGEKSIIDEAMRLDSIYKQWRKDK